MKKLALIATLLASMGVSAGSQDKGWHPVAEDEIHYRKDNLEIGMTSNAVYMADYDSGMYGQCESKEQYKTYIKINGKYEKVYKTCMDGFSSFGTSRLDHWFDSYGLKENANLIIDQLQKNKNVQVELEGHKYTIEAKGFSEVYNLIK